MLQTLPIHGGRAEAKPEIWDSGEEDVVERLRVVETVLERASEASGYTVEDLIGHGRPGGLVDARQAAWYVLRTFHRMYWHDIAAPFDRDRSTVCDGVMRFKKRANADEELRLLVLAMSPVSDPWIDLRHRVEDEIAHTQKVLASLESTLASIDRELARRSIVTRSA